MSAWLRRRGWLDVERSDWMRSPGRTATLDIGPLSFYADSSDGGAIGFAIRLGRVEIGWLVAREAAS